VFKVCYPLLQPWPPRNVVQLIQLLDERVSRLVQTRKPWQTVAMWLVFRNSKGRDGSLQRISHRLHHHLQQLHKEGPVWVRVERKKLWDQPQKIKGPLQEERFVVSVIIQGKEDQSVIIPVSMKRLLCFIIPLNIPCLTRVYYDKFTWCDFRRIHFFLLSRRFMWSVLQLLHAHVLGKICLDFCVKCHSVGQLVWIYILL
jgi:hypothetical protein